MLYRGVVHRGFFAGIALVSLVFLGMGCQKASVEVDRSESANRQPFELRDGVELGLSLESKDLEKAKETSRVVVVAEKMGVAFSYDANTYTIGSVGFDSNPNNEAVMQSESQFLGVMNKETLGEGEAQPYVVVFKNLFLNGGSYTQVESSLGGKFSSVKERVLDGVPGREYHVTGEEGYYLVFPFKADVALEIAIPDSSNSEVEKILESVRLAQTQ